ncbi:MAG: hypothetical protein KatS3mg111_0078 [Pirellulaceae bacterium]|nr:MAG: hypothetical protein KatS3mg111_0078 [Pirellulaceae bacterium]
MVGTLPSATRVPSESGLDMHAFELVHLANTFAHLSASQLRLGYIPNAEAAHQLWLACRFRHEEWSSRLAEHRSAITRPGSTARLRRWHSILPIIQEVLLSEPLTRCLAYHFRVAEERGIDREFSPLMHSLLNAHVEARHRCLHLLVFGAGIPSDMTSQLNALRQHLERFCDALLDLMVEPHGVDIYRFGAKRKATVGWRAEQKMHHPAWQRFAANWRHLWLERVLRPMVDPRLGTKRFHAQIAESVLAAIPPLAFDSRGMPLGLREANFFAVPHDNAPPLDAAGNSSPLDLLAKRDVADAPPAATGKRWS